jgi:hypothetical protein
MSSPIIETFALGAPPWRTIDPFLFCVHHADAYPKSNAAMGPATSLAGRRLGQDFGGKDGWNMYHGQTVPGFPAHPHRGFETVTVTRRGHVDHADSLGATARYGAGDVQWLTAGDGIQHAEMFPLLREDGANPLELFQIWLNLPAASKRVAPHFSMFWAPSIPKILLHDQAGQASEIRVVAGALAGHTPPKPPPHSWASQPDSGVAIWTARLAPNARWTLPPAPPGVRRTVYFFAGETLDVGGTQVRNGTGVEVRVHAPLTLTNSGVSGEVLVLQGRPIGEPVAQHGPFVMNTRAEIQQAYADYRATRFGGWPWPSSAPVHGRKAGRFARHADGREERPPS